MAEPEYNSKTFMDRGFLMHNIIDPKRRKLPKR